MFTMDENDAKARIARRIALEFSRQSAEQDFFVNLGVGLPTMVADYITSSRVYLQTENGLLGCGPRAKPGMEDPQLINAGRERITETVGCAYISSDMAFGMIRGGHIDATVPAGHCDLPEDTCGLVCAAADLALQCAHWNAEKG
jgi:3-oxoacid CoA-transferase B subunit